MKRIILSGLLFLLFQNFILIAQDKTEEAKFALSLFNKGKSAEKKYLYDSALVYYNQADNIYSKRPEWVEFHLICQTKVGDMKMAKGHYYEAIALFQKIIDKALEYKDAQDKYLISPYTSLGTAYFYTGQFDSSDVYIRKSLDLIIIYKGDSVIDVAQRQNILGSIYTQKGEYLKALDYYEKALDLTKRKLGENHQDNARIYINMAAVYNDLGQFDKIIEYNNKAIDLMKKTVGDKNPVVALAYYNIGKAYYDKSEYEYSQQYTLKSLEIRREIFGDKHPDVAQTYQLLANIFKEKEDFDIAIQYYMIALDIQKEVFGDKHPDLVATNINLGQLYRSQGNYDLALRFFNQALEMQINLTGEKHPIVASIYNNIGLIYYDQKNLQQSIQSSVKSIEIFEAVYGKKSPNLVKSYLNIANAYLDLDSINKSLEYFQKSIIANVKGFKPDSTNNFINPALANYFDQKTLLESLSGKAKVLQKLSNKMKNNDSSIMYRIYAVNTHIMCDTLIDKIRQSIVSKNDKIDLGEKAAEIYDDAMDGATSIYRYYKTIDFQKAKYYLKIAFYFSERNKASTLLEAISGVQAQKFAGIPDSLINLEKKINEEIAFYDNQLALVPNAQEEIKCRNKLFELNKQLRELIEGFEKKYPKYFQMKYSSKSIPIEEIQKRIDEKTAIRSYCILDKDILIFTILKDTSYIQSVGISKSFLQNIEKMKDLIISGKAKDFTEYQKIALEGYYKLFPENIPEAITKMIIVPDGVLAVVPFEALFGSRYEGDPKDYKNFPFLIKRFSFCYAYSTNLFYYSTFKDTLNRPTNEWIGFAPGFLDNTNTQEYNGVQVAALPGTVTEVNNISKEFTIKSFVAETVVNHSATEYFIKTSNLKDYKYIHIATHGFVNPEKPELSGILLSKEPEKINDGVLYSGEIYNLSLNADLVVLSACETGVGKIKKGEGIIGLGRALIYAGAKNLVVSLWKVSDVSTTNLMIDFYKNLLLNSNIKTNQIDFSEPLRQAKLKMIQDPKYAHPFYWSPFVLIGK